MTRRGGRCVVTGLAAAEWRIGAREFVLTGKSLLANYMGMSDFRADFAKLTRLYRDGQLLLDEMVSRTIGIDDYAEAFRAMTAGEVARSVITFAT